jgi:hypothetical protein
MPGLQRQRRTSRLQEEAFEALMTEIPELTKEQFAGAIPARVRKRLMLGQLDSGEDVAALRRFVGLTQEQFALARASACIPSVIGSRAGES